MLSIVDVGPVYVFVRRSCGTCVCARQPSSLVKSFKGIQYKQGEEEKKNNKGNSELLNWILR